MKNFTAEQTCAWTGFWIFWNRTPVASNRIRNEVFFPVAGSRLDLDFVLLKKLYCLFGWLIFIRTQTESDCLNLVGTGSGLDSKFVKQDWIRAQENHSPNTSTAESANKKILKIWGLHHNSDSVTRVNVSTRVTICGDSGSTRVTLFTEWLNSSQSQCLETRVKVIFTKSLSSWWTNPVHLHTKNSDFLLQWWSSLGEIFCFDCLVVLCCILRTKCPQLP